MTTQSIRSEVIVEIEKLQADVVLAVGNNDDPRLLAEALQAIGKMLLDPQQAETASPVPQMWRLLMGLHIGGKMSNDQLYELSGRFAQCALRLYPISE
ncbi:hypothetical protein IAI51_07150 [Pseudomonas sp. N40(2020)]|uniref:hypothetical protein n=1 Tax=Pseudomonas sp. N40(2020) TaxID=2767798 RepID=UPI001656C638|nr:hypothetical protein [Pseudomonas sp. N40(2020)]MBC8996305.1 hypothetical protein [Pseudomonas sp. N40(2020)]